MKKALITDHVHERLISGLEDLGYEVYYQPEISPEEVLHVIEDYEGIVINSKIKMYKPQMDRGIHLKWIARLGSGLEIIDIPYAESKDISVFNSPEGNRNAVGEHTLGMILAWCNHIIRADREVRDFTWHREANRGVELEGKTIGVIGYGQMGSSFVSKLSSWELEVLIFDKYKPLNFEKGSNLRAVSLEDILNQSDFISLHLPYNDETHHLVDFSFLEKCKTGVVIVNSSRGAIVDTAALVECLESDKVGGACLDVYENEKPNTYTQEERALYGRLYDMDQVVLTPHIAGWTKESLFKIADTIVRKVAKSS